MARISLGSCTLHYPTSSFYKDQIFILAPNTKINCVSLWKSISFESTEYCDADDVFTFFSIIARKLKTKFSNDEQNLGLSRWFKW